MAELIDRRRVLIGCVWLLLALLVGCEVQRGDFYTDSPGFPSGSELGFSVLTVNVGNSDPRCLPVLLKLCRNDVEKRLAENIQKLAPDVIAFQETLPPDKCPSWLEIDPGNSCSILSEQPQVRRLVGDKYTIVCESRNSYECIAVHESAGSIQDCAQGELCITERVDIHEEGCRSNVSVMGATVEVRGKVFDIINAHPESRNAECRAFSIQQIFARPDGTAGLVQEDHVLIVGDLNMDPWREDDVSVQTWNSYVGSSETHPFYYHSGVAESQPPFYTLQYPTFSRTYDHVVSNFLFGTTVVLGESPGTVRLDGGSGMDHRAVYGSLSFQK